MNRPFHLCYYKSTKFTSWLGYWPVIKALANNMKTFNRSLITLYATQELLDWVIEKKPEYHRWTLKHINYSPTAYMIEVEDQNCHGLVLEKYYKNIIEYELGSALYIDKEQWPKNITYELFLKWFNYQYHEEVCDLSDKELITYDE